MVDQKTDKTSDADGKVSFEGFLGTYKYTISSGGKTRSGTFILNNSKQSAIPNKITLSLDSTFPDNVSISTTKPACLCEGESIILNAPSGTGLSYKWYRGTELLPDQTASIVASQSGAYSVKVAKGTVESTSEPLELKVNALPQSVISTSGGLSFCPGGKVSFTANSSNDLTYNWMKGATKIQGSVKSLDITDSGTYSLITSANGCSSVSTPVVVNVYSPTDPMCTTGLDQKNNLVKVYPNPFKDSFIVESASNFQIPGTLELFNEAGICIFRKETATTESKTTIPVSGSGFYMLRISNPNAIQTFKLVSNL